MTIQIAIEETRCCHIGYSFQLAARVLLNASFHRHNTYHGLCYTSHGALAGTSKNSELNCKALGFDSIFVMAEDWSGGPLDVQSSGNQASTGNPPDVFFFIKKISDANITTNKNVLSVSLNIYVDINCIQVALLLPLSQMCETVLQHH